LLQGALKNELPERNHRYCGPRRRRVPLRRRLQCTAEQGKGQREMSSFAHSPLPSYKGAWRHQGKQSRAANEGKVGQQARIGNPLGHPGTERLNCVYKAKGEGKWEQSQGKKARNDRVRSQFGKLGLEPRWSAQLINEKEGKSREGGDHGVDRLGTKKMRAVDDGVRQGGEKGREKPRPKGLREE